MSEKMQSICQQRDIKLCDELEKQWMKAMIYFQGIYSTYINTYILCTHIYYSL